ncbi:hypothetical protein ACP4OV_018443 [Aristida adscensionis]
MQCTMSLLTPLVVVLAFFLLSSTTVISDSYDGKCPSVRKDTEKACQDARGTAEGPFYELCLKTLHERFNGSTYELAEYTHAATQAAAESYNRTVDFATTALRNNHSLSGEVRAAYLECMTESTYKSALESIDRIAALLPKNCTGLDLDYQQASLGVGLCKDAVSKLPSPPPLLDMVKVDASLTSVAYTLYFELVDGQPFKAGGSS